MSSLIFNKTPLQLVREWGGVTSEAVLNSCTHFSDPSCEGLIGYRTHGRSAVVLGEPICPPEQIEKLVSKFHEFCAKEGKSVLYLAAREPFAKWSHPSFCKIRIEFGQEMTLNPQEDHPKEGAHGRLVRRKLRHATKEGVAVKEYTNQDPVLEAAMEKAAKSWLKRRHGFQLYISELKLFNNRLGKRWFYACHQDQVVGVLMATELRAKKGWLFNRLAVAPGAPHGTPELLVLSAIDTIKAEGSSYISFSVVTNNSLGEVQGLGIASTYMVHGIFQLIKLFFPISGTKKFWEKFCPHPQPLYLLFSNKSVKLSEINSLLKALNISFFK